MNHLLSWIIWLPVLGMVAIAFIPTDKHTDKTNKCHEDHQGKTETIYTQNVCNVE